MGNYLDGNVDRMLKAVRYFEWPQGAVILMAPQAAKLQVAKGVNKEAFKDYVWKNAAVTMKELKSDYHYSWFIEPNLKGKEIYGEKYVWPKEYLGLSDDAIVPIFPRKYVLVIVVGGDANPMMQAWKFSQPTTASVDKWR